MTAASSGPRRAVRTADEAAQSLWRQLVHEYKREQLFKDFDDGARWGLSIGISALTGEDPADVRVRAERVTTENEEN